MAWDGAPGKWFLRRGKLVRKPISLRLTPRNDTANVPPYLPLGPVAAPPASMPPGRQHAPSKTFSRNSRVALGATIVGSVITATFGGGAPTDVEHRAPIYTKISPARSVAAQTQSFPNFLTREVVVATPPPITETPEGPRAPTRAIQIIHQQGNMLMLSSGLKPFATEPSQPRAAPAAIQIQPQPFFPGFGTVVEAPRGTQALSQPRYVQAQPAHQADFVLLRTTAPLPAGHQDISQPRALRGQQPQAQPFFPGFGTVETPPPFGAGQSQPKPVLTRQAAHQADYLLLRTAAVESIPPFPFAQSQPRFTPPPQIAAQVDFLLLRTTAPLPPGRPGTSQPTKAPARQADQPQQANLLMLSTGLKPPAPTIDQPRSALPRAAPTPQSFFPGFGAAEDKPRQAEIATPSFKPVAQQAQVQQRFLGFAAEERPRGTADTPAQRQRAEPQRHGDASLFPGFQTAAEPLPPGVSSFVQPRQVFPPQQAQQPQRFLGFEFVDTCPIELAAALARIAELEALLAAALANQGSVGGGGGEGEDYFYRYYNNAADEKRARIERNNRLILQLVGAIVHGLPTKPENKS